MFARHVSLVTRNIINPNDYVDVIMAITSNSITNHIKAVLALEFETSNINSLLNREYEATSLRRALMC